MADYKWQTQVVPRFIREVISGIVAACGTGKTRAGIRLAIAKRLPVIVIAPKNICRQWRDSILEVAGPDQKIWVYDMVEETKQGDVYQKRFLEWLEMGEDEIEALKRTRE
jgi:superfamily II DNA or RNA helicase